MEKTREGLCSLINKVDICLKGNVISNEEVLKIEEQFLTEAYKDGREHKTLFIQHTGSDYYDAIAFTSFLKDAAVTSSPNEYNKVFTAYTDLSASHSALYTHPKPP